MHVGGRVGSVEDEGFSPLIVREIGDIALFCRGIGGKGAGTGRGGKERALRGFETWAKQHDL